MNREAITKILVFAAGAGIGSAVTWKVLKTKYEQQVAEEVESVKEAFADRQNTVEKEEEEPSETDESEKEEIYLNESITKAKKIAESMGYSSDDDGEDESEEEEEEEEEEPVEEETTMSKGPYVIEPEEFGECDYAMQSFTYYTDGIVTNEDNKIVRNVDELIGEDSLNHFGEYEDDSVFVRNDKLRIDFEILKDYREYAESI